MLFQEVKPFVRYARYLNLDADASYRPHIPYDARLFYVSEGHGRIETEGKIYEMVKGSVMLLNAGVEYHLITPECFVSYLAVNFDYTFAHSHHRVPIPPQVKSYFRRERILENVRFDDVPQLNDAVYVRDMFRVEQRMKQIEYEYLRKRIYYEQKTGAIFAEVLTDVVRKVKSRIPEEERDATEMILDYIHENYREVVTYKEIGERFGFHPNYISDMVKRNTGMPLHKYLMHVRISRAMEYLEEGTLPIGVIACKCGFHDIYYFSRYFKEVTGVAPTEYRRR